MNVEIGDLSELKQTLSARPPRVLRGTLVVLVALLGSATVWSAATQADLVVRSAGRVRASDDEHSTAEQIASSVGGRAVEVNFRLGRPVRKGQVLFRLDTQRIEIEILKKKERAASTREEAERLRRLRALLADEYEASRAKSQADRDRAASEMETERRQLGLELERAKEEEGRIRALVAQEALPRVDLEKAQARRRDAEEKLAAAGDARVRAAERHSEWVAKDYAVRHEELELRITAKRAESAAEEKDLANLERERDQSVLRAPSDGRVTAGELRVGDLVEAGKTVVTLAREEGFRIDVPIPTSEAGTVRAGMKARVKLDAYDYQKYGAMEGTVESLSPDSLMQEGRAFYVAVVALTGGEFRGEVNLGMTAVVEIVTGRESLLAVFAKKIRHTISLN